MAKARGELEIQESTELWRRNAVWLFPSMFLLHTVFVRALAPGFEVVNLVAAVAAGVGGFFCRRLQRSTAVLATMFAFGSFAFVYMFGVAAPLSYLALVGRHDWIPRLALVEVLLLGSLIAFRVRASLREEWSKPLDQTSGVHIATNDWILRREFGRSTPVFNMVASILGIAFVIGLALTRGSPEYLRFILMVTPICIALLTSDGVARIAAFYIAVRRWEATHGLTLRFPQLPSRMRRTARRRSRR